MKIKGIFCQTTAATNEEYRKIVKDRNKYMAVLIIVGIVIAAAAFIADAKGAAALPEYMLGVYAGAGTGIAAAGLILMVRNLMLLKDEKKLKESRLENSDERLSEISNHALKSAFEVMLIATLAVSMIGGIFYPILVKILLFILMCFMLSYIVSFRIYERKM